MIGVSVVVRGSLNRRFEAPQLLCDEFIYAGIAKSFATTGHLSYRGGPESANLLYPVLIAPAWLAQTMTTTYGLAKAINASAISLTAVPVYLWARRVVSPGWALVPVALVLLLPALVLSGMLMSENASLPTFTLALFAIGIAVERPTLPRQGLVLLAVPVAYEARTQSLTLLAILPTALFFRICFDARAGSSRRAILRGLRGYVPLAIAFGLGAIVLFARNGFSPRSLGTYEAVAHAHYHLASVGLWTLRHAGEASLALGVAPMCALVLLVLIALTRSLPQPEDRAFVATAAAAVIWVFVVAGAFASTVTNWIVERYSFYAFPPLIIAFVFCLARGVPRPRLETAAAAIIAIAFVPLVIGGVFLRQAGAFNTLTLHLFTRIVDHAPGGLTGARILISLLALVAVALFALAPAWFARPALPALLAFFFFLGSHTVFGYLVANSQRWVQATGPQRSWIDAAVGTDANKVGYIYIANPSVSASTDVLLNTEFWNRSVGDIYTLGSQQLCPLSARPLGIDNASGELVEPGTDGRRVRQRYLVTDGSLDLAGTAVRGGGSPVQPLTVYRPTQPARLASRTFGVFADGWTGADATFVRYWSPKRRSGSVVVTAGRAGWTGSDVKARVTLAVRTLSTRSGPFPTEHRTWTAHAGRSRTFRLRVPQPPFEVTLHVAPTFSPSTYGVPDSRQLGVQLSVSYSQTPAR